MADVKISDLPASDALTGDEAVPVVQAGATKRATVAGLQRIPVNNQTGTTYALAASDAGACVRADNAAAIAVTAPTGGIFTVGDVILLRQVGAGQVTVTGGTLNLPAAIAAAKTRAQGSVITLHYVATDTWDVSGDLA